MRILLCSRNYFPTGVVGGAQVSIRILAQALTALGHDVAVLSVDDHPHRGVHAETEVEEYRLKLKNVATSSAASVARKLVWHSIDRLSPLMISDYKEAIAEFKPDVINTNVMAGIGLGIWRAAKDSEVPIVHTVHDYYLMCIKSGMRSSNANCRSVCSICDISALRTSRPASQYVREVIYVSQHMQNAHQQADLFSPGTGATIIHGAYAPKTTVKNRAGRIDRDRLTIGFFGRISPEKGLDRLILALRAIDHGCWRLTVGGSGAPEYVAEMKKLAQGLPVTFMGVLPPDEFYNSVDAVVISSLWNDPAPRVAYEAGLHGVAPIVSARGGLPELVGNGARGIIFDPDTPGSLTNALSDLMLDTYRLLSFQENWSKFSDEFCPESVARRTLDVYARAIAASSTAKLSA